MQNYLLFLPTSSRNYQYIHWHTCLKHKIQLHCQNNKTQQCISTEVYSYVLVQYGLVHAQLDFMILEQLSWEQFSLEIRVTLIIRGCTLVLCEAVILSTKFLFLNYLLKVRPTTGRHFPLLSGTMVDNTTGFLSGSIRPMSKKSSFLWTCELDVFAQKQQRRHNQHNDNDDYSKHYTHMQM